MELLPTTAIQIPVAVYAYQRHKQPSDPHAVKRIGFYDKRKVKEETKFQNYYVRAKAIPSKTVFKEEQMYLINRDNALVAARLKSPPKKGEKKRKKEDRVETLRLTDGTLAHEGRYINKKTSILNGDDTRTDVYIPVKYFQANATQVTQKLEGLLAYSGAWHLYNGNHKNIDIFYLPKQRQLDEYTIYTTERRIVFPKDENNDGRISGKEIINGFQASLLQNIKKLFDCEDVEYIYLGIANAVVPSCVFASLYFNVVPSAVIITAEAGLAVGVGEIVANAVKYIITFIKSFGRGNEASSGLALPADFVAYAWDMLPILKSEDKAAFVAWAARVYNLSPTETVDESSIMDMLRSLGDTLWQQGSEILEALYEMLRSFFLPIITGFIQFCKNGAVLGENKGNFIKQAGVALLNLSGANGYINIILFMIGLVDGTYDSKIGAGIINAYQGLVCAIAKLIKYVINGAIYDFINPFLAKEHKKLVLKGFPYWKQAESALDVYAKNQNIKLIYVEEKTPRFVMQTSAEKRTIYNQLNTRPKSFIIDKEGIPYVYVVAKGSKETGEKYWYFYMYEYDKDDDRWIFAVYETDKTFNKKKTLSSPIPNEPGGEWCRRRINGITVSGIPYPFYLVGSALAPLMGGYILAFLQRLNSKNSWMLKGSMKWSSWTPTAVKNVLAGLKEYPSKGLEGIASMINWIENLILIPSNMFVNLFKPGMPDGIGPIYPTYLQSKQFLRDFFAYLLLMSGPIVADIVKLGEVVAVPDVLITKYAGLPLSILKIVSRMIQFFPCVIGVFLYNRVYNNQQDYTIFE